MKTSLALPCLLASTLLAFAADPPVTYRTELAPDGRMKPNSTVEVRFPRDMVPGDTVGRPGADSPLTVEPVLAGRWTWLSPRSGVFQPLEQPKLGVKFTFQIRNGIADVTGAAFRSDTKHTIQAPDFRIKGVNALGWWDDKNASAVPKYSICFSADVDITALGKAIWFEDAKKNRIEAKVEAIDLRKTPYGGFPAHRSDDRSSRTWAQDFQKHLADPEPQPQPRNDEEDEEQEAAPPPFQGDPIPKNQAIISAAKALPPGKGWKLMISGEITALDGMKLARETTQLVGDVLPFTLASATTENLIHSGKRAMLRFSKPLAQAVQKEPAKFISVEPAVENLRIDGYGGDANQVMVSGAFELGKDYLVRIAGDLAAAEPFTLGTEVRQSISFSPVKSRLYFQGFSAQQQRSGSRQFHLLGINVRNLRLSAKVVPAEAAASAFEAYSKYRDGDRWGKEEWIKKVDDAAVAGSSVWQKDVVLDSRVDEKKVLALNWDDILGPGKSGLVFLTAEQTDTIAPNVKRVGTQALVQVTDLGIVWKDSGDYFFHVFSHTTAQPVANAAVRLLDDQGKLITETQTAADGTARLPAQKENDNAPQPRWLQVQRGEDQHYIDFDYNRDALEFGRFRINVWGDEEDIMLDEMAYGSRRRGFLFSDRPVYRPGETAHIKGIVRSYMPSEPRIPAGVKATLRVNGPKNRLVLEQPVTLSENGSFTTDVVLPSQTVGYYRAVLLFGNNADDEWSDIATGFSVQEYSPNAFEIKVTPPTVPVTGSPTELLVSAKYYMGKPLSKAQLTWTVRATDERFMPTGFEEFDFTESLYDWRLLEKVGGDSRFSAQGKVDIGNDGTAKVAFTVPKNGKLPQPRRIRFLSEITDVNQQTVAESTEFYAHSSDFYLGLRKMPELLREGDDIPVQVVAVGVDGTPLADAVDAEVKITRIEWQTNRVEEADEAENFRSQPLMELVGSVPLKTMKVVKKGSKWVLERPDLADRSFKAEKPGLYLISAVGRDGAGRDVITTASVYVYGKDQLAWNYRNRFQVELVADKAEYKPGEEATILVKTPIAGPALVTVERENVRRHFVTTLEGNAPAVKVKLDESDAPNVYVSVLVLRGSEASTKKFRSPEFRVGYVDLRIQRTDAKLYVNLKPSKTQVQPREEVNLLCEVRDSEGRTVPGAEVTLWAADEGILSLTGFETPDPLKFFSKLLRLSVTTGLTLEKLLGEDPDEHVFENKGYLVGGFGKGGDANVRRNFLGTAFWNGNLRTDAQGNVNVRFPAPDGLTRYRVMAVVQTKRDQFGHAASAFEINKPLMLEPAVPRFATVGDRIPVRAVLHNTTEHTGEVVVRLQLDDKATAESTERKVQLPAKASIALDFPVEFTEAGQVRWVWRADFAAGGTLLQDAVESQFKVVFPTPMLREVKQRMVQGAESNLLEGLDPALLDGRGTVRVSVSGSIIFELNESVRELLNYPYGCVEQTTSSMLPWVALKDHLHVLPSLAGKADKLKPALERGVARLASMQNADGGLGYWPGAGRSELWASAYGGMGIALAMKAGATAMAEEDTNRLWEFLGKALRGAAATTEVRDLSAQLMACYALAVAGRPEAAYHEVLYNKRADLTQEQRALLALAILESRGDARMANTLLTLRDKAVAADPWFGSIERAQGIRLLAWAKLAPKSDGTLEIARALLNLRKKGHWYTTQGNIWALLGLTEYARKTEGQFAASKGALIVGGIRSDFTLTDKACFAEKEFPFTNAKSLVLQNPGKHRLYVQVTLEARPRTLVTERADRGLSVERRYQRILDDGSLAELGEPQVGDRVLVTLALNSSQPYEYVVIDDPLPAVFEAVNPEFKTQQMAGAARANTWASDYNELRDDRAVFFAYSLWPRAQGAYEIRYLARVRAAGTVTAPPTKIEAMYDPARFGLGASQIITARALK